MGIRNYPGLRTNQAARLPTAASQTQGYMELIANSSKKTTKTGRITTHIRGEKDKTELAYEEYLKTLQLVGEVSEWWFEPTTFVLADRATYTPDFVVKYRDGHVEIIEIKGHVEDDAAAKFRIARGLFPWLTFRMLKRSKSKWKEVLRAKSK